MKRFPKAKDFIGAEDRGPASRRPMSGAEMSAVMDRWAARSAGRLKAQRKGVSHGR